MRYYLIAGEKSGDLHAANLMRALRLHDEDATFRGFGGDEMQQAGLELVTHYREMAFMGVWEVLTNLLAIRKLLVRCKQDILHWQPDVVILVDYAGFNLRIAEYAKKQGFRTFYYISPKIWAWNQGRAHRIRRVVDRMFVIMHFEKAFYARFGMEVDYVGNPVLDAVRAFVPDPTFEQRHRFDKPLIAILPGSRRQEIANMLGQMVELAAAFPAWQFVVAGVTNVPRDFYALADAAGLPVIFDQTYDLLHRAHAALVTSGTATLETALFRVPQVVCYRTSPVTYHLAKAVIKVRFLSLVNLIADKKVVTELIQDTFQAANLKAELSRLLDGPARQQVLADYAALYQLIYTPGASQEAARLMWQYLQKP